MIWYSTKGKVNNEGSRVLGRGLQVAVSNGIVRVSLIEIVRSEQGLGAKLYNKHPIH